MWGLLKQAMSVGATSRAQHLLKLRQALHAVSMTQSASAVLGFQLQPSISIGEFLALNEHQVWRGRWKIGPGRGRGAHLIREALWQMRGLEAGLAAPAPTVPEQMIGHDHLRSRGFSEATIGRWLHGGFLRLSPHESFYLMTPKYMQAFRSTDCIRVPPRDNERSALARHGLELGEHLSGRAAELLAALLAASQAGEYTMVGTVGTLCAELRAKGYLQSCVDPKLDSRAVYQLERRGTRLMERLYFQHWVWLLDSHARVFR
jgi:hypothetical protein